MGMLAHLLTRCSKWWGFPVAGVIHALTGNLGLSTTLVFAPLVLLLTAPWSHCFSFTWSQYYFLLLMLLSVPGFTHPLNPTYFQTISFLLLGLLFHLLGDPPNSLLLACSGSPIHAPTPNSFSFSHVFSCQVSSSHVLGSNRDFSISPCPLTLCSASPHFSAQKVWLWLL